MPGEKKQVIRQLPRLFKQSFRELVKNDPLRMAGATAFFTTFALPAIMVILIQMLGLMFNEQKMSSRLFARMSDVVGKETVKQVMNVLKELRIIATNWYITIGGFIFLLFVATTLFLVIKRSVNQLWMIRIVSKRKIYYELQTRLQSFLVIVFVGIFFLAGLLVESVRVFIGRQLEGLWNINIPFFETGLDVLTAIIIVTGWFTVLLRYLPDGRPSWRVALTGGFVTSLLFNLGKWILRWLLSYSNLNSLYGTSASIVLLLLFVFYSSLILYFGAAFTRVWGEFCDDKIKTLSHARYFKLAEQKQEVE
ncbi:MAG TPA: YihY/virulence factor BrkB family protein [Chitinophagaceae bacterium]|jgi:Predicted membrane protein